MLIHIQGRHRTYTRPHQHVSILPSEHLPILTAMAATSRTPSVATSSEPSSQTTTPRQFPQYVAGWLIHVGFSDLCAVRHQATQHCNHCRYRETARWPGTCLSPSTDVTGDRIGTLRALSGAHGDSAGLVEAKDSAGTGILPPKDTVTSLPSAGIDKSSSGSARRIRKPSKSIPELT